MFSLDDRTLHFPHAETERVPVPMLMVYSIALPALLILLSTLVNLHKTRKQKFHQLHVSLLGLAISLMLATFITDTIKNGYGRPRPDLIARCKPKEGTPGHELVSIEVCTERDHHTLYDGFRSFPSGHSSFSWSGLGFLSLLVSLSFSPGHRQVMMEAEQVLPRPNPCPPSRRRHVSRGDIGPTITRRTPNHAFQNRRL